MGTEKHGLALRQGGGDGEQGKHFRQEQAHLRSISFIHEASRVTTSRKDTYKRVKMTLDLNSDGADHIGWKAAACRSGGVLGIKHTWWTLDRAHR